CIGPRADQAVDRLRETLRVIEPGQWISKSSTLLSSVSDRLTVRQRSSQPSHRSLQAIFCRHNCIKHFKKSIEPSIQYFLSNSLHKDLECSLTESGCSPH